MEERITIRLDAETLKGLRTKVEETNGRLSKVVREAINQYLLGLASGELDTKDGQNVLC